jgi:hypothetical protein
MDTEDRKKIKHEQKPPQKRPLESMPERILRYG